MGPCGQRGGIVCRPEDDGRVACRAVGCPVCGLGDHLDRLNELEDAWSVCSSEAGDDRKVNVEIALAPGRAPVLLADGAQPLIDCFQTHFPWRDGAPAAMSAELTLHVEYLLNTPDDP